MTTTSSGFEFLNTAPIRFDGGPEMEWIAWLEQQKQLVKVANQHKMIAQETLAQANQYNLQQQLMEQQQQQQQKQSSVAASQHQHATAPSSPLGAAKQQQQEVNNETKTLSHRARQSFSSIVLGACGIFVSTILFAVLFTGHSKEKKQYQEHNKLVYQHSVQSLAKGVRNLLLLPVAWVYERHFLSI